MGQQVINKASCNGLRNKKFLLLATLITRTVMRKEPMQYVDISHPRWKLLKTQITPNESHNSAGYWKDRLERNNQALEMETEWQT